MRLAGATLATLAILCGVAQAEPSQWNSHLAKPFHPIAEGETVQLPVHGPVTFYDYTVSPHQLAFKAACQGTGQQTFQNAEQHGRGQVTQLAFTECADVNEKCAGTGITITTAALPWLVVLEAQPESFTDEMQAMAFTAACGNGRQFGTFTGTLSTSVGDVDDGGLCPSDDADAHQIFKGMKSGVLAGPNSHLQLNGKLEVPDNALQPWRNPCPTGALAVRPISAAPFGEHES